MALHTVRVELHGGTDEEYKNLRKSMREAGFLRTISKNGSKYELPTAEYRLQSKKTTKEVRGCGRHAEQGSHAATARIRTRGILSARSMAASHRSLRARARS